MWQLDGGIASAKFGNLTITVALAAADRKLLVETEGPTLLARLWDLPAVAAQPLIEHYVRDNDLVCLLAPTDRFPFYTQLYWTLRPINSPPPFITVVSLLVAIRTDLLNTHPSIEVCSKAPHSSLATYSVGGGPAYVVPLREQVTLIDFATPDDCVQQAAHETADGLLAIERTLFGHFLEKGVIRSGRLFAALVSGEVSEQTATAVCRDMLAAELPLTT